MPEFTLNRGDTADDQRAFAKLPEFVQGYIEAMFFTHQGAGDDAIADDASVSDISPEALASIIADCEAFQTAARVPLDCAYDTCDYSEEQAGRDFWFTRNGHGVGFWDRDELGELGDVLASFCGWRSATGLGEMWPYTGDDGLIYVA